ncbi:hypothetical protein [Streptomyces sp. CBMA123]|uniref:hypothetical protein n=1 Tax=Streptomyces sp. CBMA123 TaxID=1896313 RepID=UPI001661AEC8|nr:hypothetical protein [Streptomyces sp. CBMA123]MBD0695051.1 hypothetical protein [Streptomyces sp. CBMA123]
MCTLAYLVQELRTGDVAVIGSESYANLHDQLLSWAECEPLVAGYCEQAGLPATAQGFTAALRRKPTEVAAKVQRAAGELPVEEVGDGAGLPVGGELSAQVCQPLRSSVRRGWCAGHLV